MAAPAIEVASVGTYYKAQLTIAGAEAIVFFAIGAPLAPSLGSFAGAFLAAAGASAVVVTAVGSAFARRRPRAGRLPSAPLPPNAVVVTSLARLVMRRRGEIIAIVFLLTLMTWLGSYRTLSLVAGFLGGLAVAGALVTNTYVRARGATTRRHF